MGEVRTFSLVRREDVSGVSGTGVVANGVQFPDGVCVIRWASVPHSSTAIYNNIQELEQIHGHEGRTRVIFHA